LVFIDLNKFKQINDTFGHAEGDSVLKMFADLISNKCQESDLFARLGGDEFVILFINTSTSAAKDTIIRLQQSLNEHKQKANNNYDISFSYGMVDFESDKYKTIEALLEGGDSQMYKYKYKYKYKK
jgi:diguanylate cyclase (GGDEF)-like protein